MRATSKKSVKAAVFMVMPFSNEAANEAYKNIVQPLCSDLKLEVKCADDYHSTKIVYDDIVAGINNAKIVIVDISGLNPNVMYELGIAHSLKQQSTIIITHDSLNSLPFDVQHFRAIGYKNTIAGAKKLETKLRKTIEAVLEQPDTSSKIPVKATTVTRQDNQKHSREQVVKTFERLSEWQKKFLINAVRQDQRQCCLDFGFNFDVGFGQGRPVGDTLTPEEEVAVLVERKIIRSIGKSSAYLIDDDFFDTLQEWDREQN